MMNGKKKLLGGLLSAMLAAGIFAGCGGQQAQQGPQGTPVKAMKVLKQDTPLTTEFAGQVRGKDEVKILPRVSGAIVENPRCAHRRFAGALSKSGTTALPAGRYFHGRRPTSM